MPASTTVTSSRGRVGDHVTAHSPRAKPALNILFEHRMMFVRVTAPAMNHPHAREARTHRLQQELFENESRILKIQTVKVQMCPNGKTAGSKVSQIKPAMRMNRAFDVFGRVLDLP